jgi:hypothetical protein
MKHNVVKQQFGGGGKVHKVFQINKAISQGGSKQSNEAM